VSDGAELKQKEEYVGQQWNIDLIKRYP